jgi:hypothetical protein
MNIKTTLRRFTMATAILAGLAVLPASAQTTDRARQNVDQKVERLTSQANLNAQQSALVRQALAGGEPAALWNAAAQLAPTLTDQQKTALLARPERQRSSEARQRTGEARQRTGEARQRTGEARQRTGEARQRPDREQMTAHRAADVQARNATLGLTADQVQRLEALHARKQGQRVDRSQMQAEVAQILSPAQLDVYRVRQALAMQRGYKKGADGSARGTTRSR